MPSDGATKRSGTGPGSVTNRLSGRDADPPPTSVGSVTLEMYRPDLVGDGYDPEPLMTAVEVSDILRVPERSVYEMIGLPRIRLGQRRVRWRPADLREFIERRVETQ